jgi:hypothetical protein
MGYTPLSKPFRIYKQWYFSDKPDIQETEEFMGNARAKSPREEDLGNWQWKKLRCSVS